MSSEECGVVLEITLTVVAEDEQQAGENLDHLGEHDGGGGEVT